MSVLTQLFIVCTIQTIDDSGKKCASLKADKASEEPFRQQRKKCPKLKSPDLYQGSIEKHN